MKWGFLREDEKAAKKAGIDKQTGLHRTGFEEYIKVIFPNVDDWIHDKVFGKHGEKNYRIRPDYRSDTLKLIVEFDGLPHYQKPDVILQDKNNQKIYESFGYKVVRIPYFIQLTNAVVKTLFDVDVDEPLFDVNIPSLGASVASPAYLCPEGIKRMAQEFKKFPEQYNVNLKALKDANEPFLTGVDYLENEYNKL